MSIVGKMLVAIVVGCTIIIVACWYTVEGLTSLYEKFENRRRKK